MRTNARYRVTALLAGMLVMLAASQVAAADGAALRFRHQQRVNNAVLSPDGERLAVDAGHTYLWDVSSQERVLLEKDEFHAAMGVKFSKDSKMLASTDGREGTVSLWAVEDIHDLKQIHRLPVAKPFAGDYIGVGFTDDDRSIITSTHQNVEPPVGQQTAGQTAIAIRKWDLKTGLPSVVVKEYFWDEGITGVEPVTDAATLILSTGWGAIAYDLKTRKEKFRVSFPLYVRSMAFSPDGNTAIAETLNMSIGLYWNRHKVKIWDQQTGKNVRNLKLPAREAGFLIFSPNSKYLVMPATRKSVVAWDPNTGKVVFSKKLKFQPKWVQFLDDGSLVALGHKDDTVMIEKVADQLP